MFLVCFLLVQTAKKNTESNVSKDSAKDNGGEVYSELNKHSIEIYQDMIYIDET